jgi:hypothetical protein
VAAKLAGNLFRIVEVGADHSNRGATFYRSLRRLYIEEEGWLVVIVLCCVIGVVLGVEGELDVGLSPVIRGRCLATGSSRVHDLGLCHNWWIESCEGTVCGVADI